MEFGDKSHYPRLRIGHLNVWAQLFHLPARQGDIMLAAQFDYGLEANIPVQMSM
jgi:hypothetical protein